MDRTLMSKLIVWKDSKHRKPLLLNGARQVGKTWLLREFGKLHFDNVAYVGLDNNPIACSFFEKNYDTRRIIDALALYLNMKILPHKTLIILDEVQACPKAITSLKYFCENAPEYAVAAAGSLLGISATEGSGFPVGKVDMFNLYPLSFLEFLDGTGNNRFAELIRSGDQQLMNALDTHMRDMLKQYYIVGGMPACVQKFAQDGDFASVRAIQVNLLAGYERDFSKHLAARLHARMTLAWESIPQHLAQENKKFVFGRLRHGGRGADFEEVLAWLQQAGLIHKVRRVSKPGVPLAAYPVESAFKVFLLDVGILGAMSGLDPVVVIEGNRAFTEFKGALTEQFVCQELVASCDEKLFYWSAENSLGEIDFLLQRNNDLYPIEVKAAENLRAKSLRAFSQKHEGVQARRFSLSGFRDDGWMHNVPLWAIGNPKNWE